MIKVAEVTHGYSWFHDFTMMSDRFHRVRESCLKVTFFVLFIFELLPSRTCGRNYCGHPLARRVAPVKAAVALRVSLSSETPLQRSLRRSASPLSRH